MNDTLARVAYDIVAVALILFCVFVLAKIAGRLFDRLDPEAQLARKDPGAATRASIKARMPNTKTRPHA